MKKITAALLSLIVFFALSVNAFADAPVYTVTTAIKPAASTTDPIKVPSGSTLALTADTLVSVDKGGIGDVYVKSQLWTNAAMNLPATGVGPAYTSTATFDSTGKTVGEMITISYSITLRKGEGGAPELGTDTDSTYVEITHTETLHILITPMAAPAVAAKILAYNNVKPSYRDGKVTGNFIADVAHEMGPQTLFRGIEKSVWCAEHEMEESNPDYRQAVLDYLNSHLKMSKELDLPSVEFFAAP